jgi:hypothetical protein
MEILYFLVLHLEESVNPMVEKSTSSVGILNSRLIIVGSSTRSLSNHQGWSSL